MAAAPGEANTTQLYILPNSVASVIVVAQVTV
jgi:hypothetical protein